MQSGDTEIIGIRLEREFTANLLHHGEVQINNPGLLDAFQFGHTMT